WSTGCGVDFFGLSGVMNSIHRFERNDTPGVLSGGYLKRGGQRLNGNHLNARDFRTVCGRFSENNIPPNILGVSFK
ncbi:MAG: hypothetical protein VXZ15_10985, partial [Planctomycetota bacterium]|nr:hypothetical protein [Planctomycetota bacterium]